MNIQDEMENSKRYYALCSWGEPSCPCRSSGKHQEDLWSRRWAGNTAATLLQGVLPPWASLPHFPLRARDSCARLQGAPAPSVEARLSRSLPGATPPTRPVPQETVVRMKRKRANIPSSLRQGCFPLSRADQAVLFVTPALGVWVTKSHEGQTPLREGLAGPRRPCSRIPT